jgi:GNAT superfamily N-acetyltransferase
MIRRDPIRLDPGDHGRALAVVSAAFDRDPLWRWAMPDDEGGRVHRRRFWSIVLDGALVHPWSTMSYSGSAVAVWIPPGEPELSAQGDSDLELLLDSMPRLATERTRSVLGALQRHHPERANDGGALAYLSLLAVRPDAQGRGEGGGLLAQTLHHVDREGWSAYLESSAQRNVHFYLRHDFVVRDLVVVAGAPVITTMTRQARRPTYPNLRTNETRGCSGPS